MLDAYLSATRLCTEECLHERTHAHDKQRHKAQEFSISMTTGKSYGMKIYWSKAYLCFSFTVYAAMYNIFNIHYIHEQIHITLLIRFRCARSGVVMVARTCTSY